MARFVKGSVVVVPFPFTPQPGGKNRPALILASWPFGAGTDYLVCMITAQTSPDPNVIALAEADIIDGSLHKNSFVRPAYMWTLAESRITRLIGRLTDDKLAEVMVSIEGILK